MSDKFCQRINVIEREKEEKGIELEKEERKK